MTSVLEVDPTELLPGDVVISLSDHEISGCHCDVRVKVLRETKENKEEAECQDYLGLIFGLV